MGKAVFKGWLEMSYINDKIVGFKDLNTGEETKLDSVTFTNLVNACIKLSFSTMDDAIIEVYGMMKKKQD